MRFLFLLIFFLIPFFTHASVVINEIAWMGTVNSANDEWIELYNNGDEDIDLNEWVLKARDDTPLINLSGIIKTKSFFLLERTDDTTIPDVPADLIYTGALSNTGEILILKNGDTEIDKVDASDGWPAGDNATKQTMQRTPDNKWVAANPTPGAQNSEGQSASQSTSTSGVDVSDEQESTTVVVWPVEPQIYANAGSDKTTVAGADVYFSGQALGLQKEPLENARYLWNFGDGAIAEGQNVKHVYKYPGEYIVVLDVSSGKYSVSDRLIVKVLENNLKIIEANENYIKLHNGSNVELDISYWFLRAGNSLFKFPANTFIKTNRDLMIDFSVSGLKAENQKAELLYPNGSVAFSYSGPTIVTNSTTVVESNPQKIEEKPKEPQIEELSTSTIQVANVISPTKSNSWGPEKWLMIVLGIGILAAGGLILVRRKSFS